MKTLAVALLSIACSMSATAQTATYQATLNVPLPAALAPNWGTTPAQVESLFVPSILANFQANPNLNATIAAMDPLMLARLSTELLAHQVNYNYWPILIVAAQRLSAPNLQRLAAVFGPGPILKVVITHAPAAVREAYYSLPSPAAYPLSAYWVSLGHGVPALDGDAYLYDLFLEYTTAGLADPKVTFQQVVRYQRRQIQNAALDTVLGAATLLGAYFAIKADPDVQALIADLKAWITGVPAAPEKPDGVIVSQYPMYPGPDNGPNPDDIQNDMLPPLSSDSAGAELTVFSLSGY